MSSDLLLNLGESCRVLDSHSLFFQERDRFVERPVFVCSYSLISRLLWKWRDGTHASPCQRVWHLRYQLLQETCREWSSLLSLFGVIRSICGKEEFTGWSRVIYKCTSVLDGLLLITFSQPVRQPAGMSPSITHRHSCDDHDVTYCTPPSLRIPTLVRATPNGSIVPRRVPALVQPLSLYVQISSAQSTFMFLY